MANSTGTHSYSTTLGIDPAGGTTYVVQAEVRKIDLDGIKVGTSDMTNLLSPSAAKEKRPGLIDSGKITLTVTWTQAQFALFLTDLRKALMGIKLTFPLVGAQVTAANLAGQGHLTSVGVGVPEDDAITSDVELEWSGLPVFTLGS